jgi:hypothetical protein
MAVFPFPENLETVIGEERKDKERGPKRRSLVRVPTTKYIYT